MGAVLKFSGDSRLFLLAAKVGPTNVMGNLDQLKIFLPQSVL
jgi:hypothetical protein